MQKYKIIDVAVTPMSYVMLNIVNNLTCLDMNQSICAKFT